jgi:hypothetical protein
MAATQIEWEISPIEPLPEKESTEWEGPSKKEVLVFALLAAISLVIALDATIISTSLDVCPTRSAPPFPPD